MSRGAAVEPTLAIDDPVLSAFAEEVGDTSPVAVLGGQTRWDLGGAPVDDPYLVRAPTGIVDYKPEEMTVKVRAGTSVADLHAALAEKGQRTALPERGGTIGGALAVGENDVCALGRGRVRESLLQVRYVSAEGRLVSSGGPTVKNVSGFDLPRLMVGSLGTLGCLAEVILRTNPIPAESRWLRTDRSSGESAPADAVAVFDGLLNPSAVLFDGSSVWVNLEGHDADVAHQASILASLGSFVAMDGPPDLPPHRWSLSPADASTFGDLHTGAFVAAIGLGLVFADEPQPARPLDPAVALISDRMKQNFDPTGRLNPGRQPGGA